MYLDLLCDMSEPESQVHRDLPVEGLVEEMRDRVAMLERSLERRSVEAERYQQIVAGLTQTDNRLSARALEQEAPVPLSSPSQASEDAAQDVSGASPERGGHAPTVGAPRSRLGAPGGGESSGGDRPCMCI